MSGITVATRDVVLELTHDNVTRRFLDNVNFLARPGEMTAIMGPSGCGKTTFLNVLSNRQARGATVTGSVLYGGRDDMLKFVNNFSAYVMQEDYMLQRLTVRETIVFAARLRLSHLSYDEQIAKAERIMNLLGLQACKDVLIGGTELKGISGGQRKRVSIAVALLDDPAILFLDEPTSGLDAGLAYDVVATLDVLAKKHGKTVIATIHQPRAEVYNMFDSLLLMRLGKVIYHGPCSVALDFTASIGHPCPDDYNPSDFYLDLLTDGSHEKAATTATNEPTPPSSGDDSTSLIGANGSIELASRIHVDSDEADKFAEAFAVTEQAQKNIRDIEKLQQNPEFEGDTPFKQSHNSKGGFAESFPRFFRSVYVLWLRGLREGSRRPEFLYVNFIQVAFLGIVVSSLYWQIEEPQIDIEECNISVARNAMGGMMQVVANTAFSSFDAATLSINRRPLVNREASGGLYTRPAAMIANWMADGMFHYWASFLLGIIFYWTMDLRHDAGAYFVWLLFIWTMKFTFWGSSTAIGAISPNLAAGMGLIPLTNVLLFQVTGFQKTDSQIPRGLVWLKNISPIRYAWQGIVRNQLDPDNTGYLEKCFGFSSPNHWAYCWLCAIAFAIVARILSLIGCQYLHRNQGVQA